MSDNPFTGSVEALQLAAWRADPVLYVRQRFGAEPDKWQHAALGALVSDDPKTVRTALQACVGVGKDAVFAWSGFWVLECKGTRDKPSQVACVAPTETQLHDTLWKEYARWFNVPQAAYLRQWFTMTTERIASREFPLMWFISARSYPKGADTHAIGATLSGIHAPVVLVQLSECATMPGAMIDTAEQARSGAEWWKLQINGNPIQRDGCLGRAVINEPDRWTIIRVTGDPDDPDRSPRIPLDMAREALADPNRGPTDPWVMAHILGKFPPGGLNTLLGPDEVAAAMRRNPDPHEYESFARILAADVARGGTAYSSIAQRQGMRVFPLTVLPSNVMGAAGAGRVAAIWRDWKADACFIDGTGGFGGSWADHLRGLQYRPIEVGFAEAANDPKFFNRRAEMWWLMCQDIKTRLALPENPTLAKQLLAVRYGFKGDRIILEGKAEVEKRLGFSLDEADSIALTYAAPVMPAGGPLAGVHGARRIVKVRGFDDE